MYYCKSIKNRIIELAISIGMFVMGLLFLILASDRFVDSAEKIGLSWGISPYIIGVTIVAFGTSLPELATSIASIYSGHSEIVVTNVVGSNITNILLVLGLTAFISKNIKFDYDIMDVDIPLLLGSAFFAYLMLQDGELGTFEVVIILGGLVAFLMNTFRGSAKEEANVGKVNPIQYLILIGSGVVIYFSSGYTIEGLTFSAKAFDIPNELVSLTALALGTSLPELFVSIAAIRKGKHGIAIGNVLGSNVFNTFGVLGIASLFGSIKIPEELINFSLPMMVAVTVLFVVISISRRVSRWEGGMLIAFYAFYIYKLMDENGLIA